MKSLNCSKPGYTNITCSKISNIPYNIIFTTKFNDSLILITIISCDYMNLSLANEYVGDVTIPTQVIKYSQNFLQAYHPIRLQYSHQIKLLRNKVKILMFVCGTALQLPKARCYYDKFVLFIWALSLNKSYNHIIAIKKMVKATIYTKYNQNTGKYSFMISPFNALSFSLTKV